MIQFDISYIQSTRKVNIFSLFVLIILLLCINIGYEYMYKKRINIALIDGYKNEIIPSYLSSESNFLIENFLYDRSDFIIFWIQFNPYQLLSDSEIGKLKAKVRATATQQGLIKLAVLLAYNNKKEEAISVLNIIENFYHVEIEYDQLLKKTIFDKICRFLYIKIHKQ